MSITLSMLVLVPLIPTVLMLRFMVEAVRAEHMETRDRQAVVYQQALTNVTVSLTNHLKNRPTGAGLPAPEILQFYQRALNGDVVIRIVDVTGHVAAGDHTVTAEPLARESLGEIAPGWRAELFLTGSAAGDAIGEQVRIYGWTMGGAILLNLVIAGAAAFSLHRKWKLHELESSSLATVAHELKTPLASTRLLLDTLLRGSPGDPTRQREYLRLIASENARLMRLAENFLTLSRAEAGIAPVEKQAVEPAEVVEAALVALEARFEETGCRPEITNADNVRPFPADREGLISVLVNLLDNALKYSGESPRIALRVRSANNRVEFAVQDHGSGIPRTEQAAIFEKFYQADQRLSRSREGCGLGLHIARSIIEAHGGTITVESAPGEGSTFRVSLPVG